MSYSVPQVLTLSEVAGYLRLPRSAAYKLAQESNRLAGLRDTLLPKLLSGEIELSDAEAIAEEVA